PLISHPSGLSRRGSFRKTGARHPPTITRQRQECPIVATIRVLLVIAALVAAAVWYWIMEYPRHPRHHVPVYGTTPLIPDAHPQGGMPTLKMPTAKGWAPGDK